MPKDRSDNVLILNQPDPEKLSEQVEDMQDLAAQIGGLLQTHQRIMDTAAEEFNTEGGVSAASCAAGSASLAELRRHIHRLAWLQAVHSGQVWFFLPEGLNEGDSPPCEC